MKGRRTAQLLGTCIDCGGEVWRTAPRGPLPKRCPACQERHGHTILTCRECGQDFPRRKGRRPTAYCLACKAIIEERRRHRSCLFCGKDFVTDGASKERCCSDECRELRRIERAEHRARKRSEYNEDRRRRQREDPAWAARETARKVAAWNAGSARTVRLNEEAVKEAFAAQGCAVCGLTIPILIDGHHLDPNQKDRDPSRCHGAGALERELKKTRPLCANHHRLMHAAMSNGGAGLSFDELVEYIKEHWPETA